MLDATLTHRTAGAEWLPEPGRRGVHHRSVSSGGRRRRTRLADPLGQLNNSSTSMTYHWRTRPTCFASTRSMPSTLCIALGYTSAASSTSTWLSERDCVLPIQPPYRGHWRGDWHLCPADHAPVATPLGRLSARTLRRRTAGSGSRPSTPRNGRFHNDPRRLPVLRRARAAGRTRPALQPDAHPHPTES